MSRPTGGARPAQPDDGGGRRSTLVDRLVSDEFWAAVGPLLPPPPRPPYGGRRRTISNRQLLCGDRLHGAHLYPVTMLAAMVDDIPPVRTPSGRRRHRPGKLDADKGYDSAANRVWPRRRGIAARIARRGIESSTRLGRHRWRVERALSWLSCYRRLAVRWDPGLGAVLCIPAAGVSPRLLQPALTSQQGRDGVY